MPRCQNSLIRIGLRLSIMVGILATGSVTALAQSWEISTQAPDMAAKTTDASSPSHDPAAAGADPDGARRSSAQPTTAALEPRRSSNDIRVIRYGRQQRIYGVR